jgi:hypothetical protein
MQPIRAENRTAEPNLRLGEMRLATLADRIARLGPKWSIPGPGYRDGAKCD